jgi:hypothetical protein
MVLVSDELLKIRSFGNNSGAAESISYHGTSTPMSSELVMLKSRHLALTTGVLLLFASLVGCADKKAARQNAEEAQAPPAPAGRTVDVKKIIYEGSIESIVEDVDPVADSVRALTQKFEGYIAASEINRSYGTHRTATFTVRVPADKYDILREEFAKLGNTVRNSSKSEDVTDEFTDLEARIRILKKEEQALEELLGKSAGKLEDVIKVREQLAKNREQIEKGEGRIKLLASKVAYSTIILKLRETHDYVPPTAPTFGNQIEKTFYQSVEFLYDLGKGLVLVVVGLAPWLPLILLGLWLVRRWIRSQRRRNRP